MAVSRHPGGDRDAGARFYGALHPGPHDGTNPNRLAMFWVHAAAHHGVAPPDENVDFTPGAAGHGV